MGTSLGNPPVSQGFRAKLDTLLSNAAAEYVTVRADDSWLALPEYCGRRLTKKKDSRRQAYEVLVFFLGQLLAIRSVEAACFLLSKAPEEPVSLVVEILMPLKPKGPDIRASVREVTRAASHFKKALRSILPVSVNFVNTAGRPLDEVEQKLKEDWTADSSLRLLGRARFERA